MSNPSAKIRFRDPQVEMAHGAGGKASRRLIDGLFSPILFGSAPAPLGDAAHVGINGTSVAITTDSFVVRPLRFPGGSIGELAVNGTVNDLAVSGARAQALVVSFILEEGLPAKILESEIHSMAAAASAAGVAIVGGDTKVVEHGKADQMYITTSGIGCLIPGLGLSRWR
jgi:hydrogenase expression/formation protein HypE